MSRESRQRSPCLISETFQYRCVYQLTCLETLPASQARATAYTYALEALSFVYMSIEVRLAHLGLVEIEEAA